MEPNTSATNILPGPISLIKQSINLYKNNYKFLLSLALLPLIIGLIQNIISQFLLGMGYQTPGTGSAIVLVIFMFVIGIFAFIVQIVFQISLLKSVYEIDKGKSNLDLKEIYGSSLRLFFPFIWVSILSALSSLFPAILLIIPGLILFGYISWSTNALICDNRRGLSALSTSFYYVRGNWWPVFWRLIVLVIVFLACGMVIGVLHFLVIASVNGSFDVMSLMQTMEQYGDSLSISVILFSTTISLFSFGVMYPVSFIYTYLIYKNLKTLKPEPNPEVDFKKSKIWFKVLSIIGTVLVILLPIIFIVSVIFIGIDSAKTRISNGQTLYSDQGQVGSNFPSNVLTLPQRTSSLEGAPYINKELGFSINFPKNWATDYNGKDVYSSINLVGESDAAITIKKITLPYKLNSDQEIQFMEGVASELISDESLVLENVSFNKYNINSLNAYLITGTMNKSDPLVNVNFYYISDDLNVYIITQEAKASVWPSASNYFIDSVNTFKTI